MAYDNVLQIRMSAEERSALTAAAERERLTLSAWARRVLLREASESPAPELSQAPKAASLESIGADMLRRAKESKL